MLFTTLTENLRNAFSIAERSTGKSLQLPIVSYVLLNIGKNQIRISATNLEQGLTISVLGKSDKECRIAVPARMVVQFLSGIKDEKIELNVSDKTLKIKTPRAQASIQGLDADDFPIIPKVSEEFLFEIPSFLLGRALSSVAISAAQTDIRPELQGISFNFIPNNSLVLAATDSFRLAESVVLKADMIEYQNGKLTHCIVPYKAIQEVIKIASEKNDNMKVAIDENQISFTWDDTEFVSRLLEGEFPNYKTIIPAAFGTRCVVKKRDFMDILRVAGLFSTRLQDVKLDINPETRMITVNSKDSAKGEYSGEMEGEISGSAISAAFNYQFLLDGLDQMQADKIFFGLNQAHTPALLRPEGNEFYTYVVMPIRI